MSATRDAILAVVDLPMESMTMPEWGGMEITVRGMNGVERDEFDKLIVPGDVRGMRAKLVAVSVCDDKGELLFTMDDCAELGKKSSKALDRIFAVAARLNGMEKEEDAEGN